MGKTLLNRKRFKNYISILGITRYSYISKNKKKNNGLFIILNLPFDREVNDFIIFFNYLFKN
jgi:hypothetical protein